MGNRLLGIIRSCCLILFLFALVNCRDKETEQEQVVIYTSLDKVFCEPMLKAFERQTDIMAKSSSWVKNKISSRDGLRIGTKNVNVTIKSNPGGKHFNLHTPKGEYRIDYHPYTRKGPNILHPHTPKVPKPPGHP